MRTPSASATVAVALALAGTACGGAAPPCDVLAVRYAVELPAASACDPSLTDACAAQRPLAVYQEAPGQAPSLTGLCDVANAGYVDPRRTAALDAALARYRAAGCTVGSCPGPAPHPPACLAEAGATPTCR